MTHNPFDRDHVVSQPVTPRLEPDTIEDDLLDDLEAEMRTVLACTDDLTVASRYVDRLGAMQSRLAAMYAEARDRFVARLETAK